MRARVRGDSAPTGRGCGRQRAFNTMLLSIDWRRVAISCSPDLSVDDPRCPCTLAEVSLASQLASQLAPLLCWQVSVARRLWNWLTCHHTHSHPQLPLSTTTTAAASLPSTATLAQLCQPTQDIA